MCVGLDQNIESMKTSEHYHYSFVDTLLIILVLVLILSFTMLIRCYSNAKCCNNECLTQSLGQRIWCYYQLNTLYQV